MSLILAMTVGCRSGSTAAPRAGSSYELSLVVLSPRHIHPDRERAIRPITDSAVATIRISFATSDTAYGSYSGLPLGFWPMFRGLDSSVSIFVAGDQWRIALDPSAADAGMNLQGRQSGGVVRGTWVTRTSSPDSGTFVLRPGA
jgi:hypothetical protein